MKTTPSIMKHMTLSSQKSPLKATDPGKGGLLSGVKHVAEGILNAPKRITEIFLEDKENIRRQPRLTEVKEPAYMITRETKKLPSKEKGYKITKTVKQLPVKGRKESVASSIKEDDRVITEDEVKVNLRNR